MSKVLSPVTRRAFHACLLAPLAFATSKPIFSFEQAIAADFTNLVRANNAFAMELLREIEKSDSRSNQFFSPFSLEAALLMALEGARNTTAAEIGNTLQLPAIWKSSEQAEPWDLRAVRKEYALASKIFADKHDELEIANSLWVDKSFPLATDFQNALTTHYGSSDAVAVDFRNNAEAERVRINNWVSSHTRDKINNVIPTGAIDAMTRLVLANAIYFRGTWSTPFQESTTKAAPFFQANGTRSSASLMSNMGFESGRYGAFNADGSAFKTPRTVKRGSDENQNYPTEDGFQVAELPYSDNLLSMMVILPRKVDGLAAVVRTLDEAKLAKISETLDAREFHLFLPKFKLEAAYDCGTLLRQLGMREAFRDAADFSGLTQSSSPDDQLKISKVLHKAFVDINEKGTEAAAATIVTFAPRSAAVQPERPFTPTFRADRPFLFVIRQRATGLVLFIGKVETV